MTAGGRADGRGRVAAALLAAALFGAAPPAWSGTAPVALSGTLRTFMCPGVDCERPPADDPGWAAAAVGPAGTAGGIAHHEGVGWAVLSFDLPAGADGLERPALLVSNPADAEVAAINGVPAGGEGVIGRRYLAVPSGPRCLDLPRQGLRPGRNELVLKILFAEKNAKVFGGPILIGESDRIALECERRRRPLIGTEAALLALFVVMTLMLALLIARGVVRSDYVLFSAFLALYTAAFVLDSHLLYFAGRASPATEQVQAVLRRVVALVVLSLVTAVTGNRFGRGFALLAAPAGALVALEAALPPLLALHWLAVPRKVILGAYAIWYLLLAARAIRARTPDAVPVLVGVIAYTAGARLDLYWGIAARDYGTAVFALAMIVAITSRHARLRARIEEISGRLLDAHEQERRRIARDIHDGVGQALLALRMRLQMLAGRTPPPEALPALAADTGAITDELRRAVLDLRPAAADEGDLAAAMRGYASSVAADHGLALRFHEGRQPLPEVPDRLRTHLFRVFQEMLANVGRHAGATRVDVSLHREGRRLVLQVADDGRGIAAGGDGGPGLGLSTMRERAELLGGTFTVESAPGRGAVVTVEVPLP